VFSYRYPSLFLSLTNYFVLGSKSTKGKPSANPTRPTIIEASDESSSATSDLSGSDNNRGNSESNDSGGEDSDADGEDDDFGTARMTEGEVRQMFDDKVVSFILNVHPAVY